VTVDRWRYGGYTGARWSKVENIKNSIFIGQYEHGIDDKNRLFLPSRFREKSRGADYILTQGLERCLFLFPIQYWHDLADKLDRLPLENKSEERAFKRILLSAAGEAEVDTQGRILVPQHLKEYAGISRHVVILGVLKHVEIWAKEEWQHYSKKARSSFEKVAPHLAL
jgi:MraZ protein